MRAEPEIGQLVIVRQRPFVVVDSVPPAPGLTGPPLVRLSSVEDDGLGEELQVLWDPEPGTKVHKQSRLVRHRGLFFRK